MPTDVLCVLCNSSTSLSWPLDCATGSTEATSSGVRASWSRRKVTRTSLPLATEAWRGVDAPQHTVALQPKSPTRRRMQFDVSASFASFLGESHTANKTVWPVPSLSSGPTQPCSNADSTIERRDKRAARHTASTIMSCRSQQWRSGMSAAWPWMTESSALESSSSLTKGQDLLLGRSLRSTMKHLRIYSWASRNWLTNAQPLRTSCSAWRSLPSRTRRRESCEPAFGLASVTQSAASCRASFLGGATEIVKRPTVEYPNIKIDSGVTTWG
mmetsp:Transcript_31876/g.74758  ORF Transcript_31876/g.74758 Transcript_31876/m.74758 type:complete len:271 (-) Transcript_31876:296-1108(-)